MDFRAGQGCRRDVLDFAEACQSRTVALGREARDSAGLKGLLRDIRDFAKVGFDLIPGERDHGPAIVERIVEIDFRVRVDKLLPEIWNFFDIGAEPG